MRALCFGDGVVRLRTRSPRLALTWSIPGQRSLPSSRTPPPRTFTSLRLPTMFFHGTVRPGAAGPASPSRTGIFGIVSSRARKRRQQSYRLWLSGYRAWRDVPVSGSSVTLAWPFPLFFWLGFVRVRHVRFRYRKNKLLLRDHIGAQFSPGPARCVFLRCPRPPAWISFRQDVWVRGCLIPRFVAEFVCPSSTTHSASCWWWFSLPLCRNCAAIQASLAPLLSKLGSSGNFFVSFTNAGTSANIPRR